MQRGAIPVPSPGDSAGTARTTAAESAARILTGKQNSSQRCKFPLQKVKNSGQTLPEEKAPFPALTSKPAARPPRCCGERPCSGRHRGTSRHSPPKQQRPRCGLSPSQRRPQLKCEEHRGQREARPGSALLWDPAIHLIRTRSWRYHPSPWVLPQNTHFRECSQPLRQRRAPHLRSQHQGPGDRCLIKACLNKTATENLDISSQVLKPAYPDQAFLDLINMKELSLCPSKICATSWSDFPVMPTAFPGTPKQIKWKTTACFVLGFVTFAYLQNGELQIDLTVSPSKLQVCFRMWWCLDSWSDGCL
ncbi:uncharacterized protein LOC111931697 [Cyanistes caeruleus]|uniref:uncharacterized protein LOC111931697 n=1 Tax=Cyanistes caeruleus TaxID=156563 RepID=UPI000CDAC12F|nr:uncharacterized protein LOC111931697 [Cyanistes caeruleus]